ncbi:MAG: TIGR01212 family radical SAM protein [Pseudomonadota bacterium]
MHKNYYNSLNTYLKKRFGCKVYKVALSSGYGCPNQPGCIFCSSDSYLMAANLDQTIIDAQAINNSLTTGMAYVKKRHAKTAKFIAYFQSGSNTNAPAHKLAPLYKQAIKHPDVVGLSIATRPDCLANEHYDLLSEIASKTMLTLELGLQSANNQTLQRIKRGHFVIDFINAIQNLQQRNITTCAHIILGLPEETKEDILRTANLLNELKVDGVKIHNLHVLKNTVLENWYLAGKINLLDLATYASWTVTFLEHLSPDILIHRVNGHAAEHLTLAPKWSINKLAILNAVQKEFEIRKTFQGKLYTTGAAKA